MNTIKDDNDDMLAKKGLNDLEEVIENIKLLKNSIVKEKRYEDAAKLRRVERELWIDVHTAIGRAWSKAQRVEWPADAQEILSMEEQHGADEVIPPEDESKFGFYE